MASAAKSSSTRAVGLFLSKLLTIAISLASIPLFAQGQLSYEEIIRTPGEVVAKGGNEIVAQGKNVSPVGKLKVKTYRLERVGEQYNLIVTGGPFRSDSIVWIEDQAFGPVPSGDYQLVLQFFGKPKFSNGAEISVTTAHDTCHIDSGSESILPDKLSVPDEYRAAPLDSGRIQLRTNRSGVKSGQQPGVEVSVRMNRPIPALNEIPVIQIGRQDFDAGSINSTISTIVPEDTFWRLRDNAQIILKWGRCSWGGQIVGRLDKAALDH
jgi:hypothetical protein